jgi:hypothetical protein
VELMVRWDVDGAPLCLRLIVSCQLFAQQGG